MNETPSGINYDLMQAFSQVFGDKTDPVIQGAETNVLKIASMLTDPEQAALASSATGCVSMGSEVPNSITLQWRTRAGDRFQNPRLLILTVTSSPIVAVERGGDWIDCEIAWQTDTVIDVIDLSKFEARVTLHSLLSYVVENGKGEGPSSGGLSGTTNPPV